MIFKKLFHSFSAYLKTNTENWLNGLFNVPFSFVSTTDNLFVCLHKVIPLKMFVLLQSMSSCKKREQEPGVKQV